MEEISSASQRVKQLPHLDDDEFCVSITKAAELTGLTESRIRYLEGLPGITIGKRRPGERNRVYSKQDVKLLRWFAQQEGRPSDIAERLKQNQEEILSSLGHVTLEQVVEYEQSAAGRDVLIAQLIALLISIWQEAAQSLKGDAIILSVIFGPQDEDWKAAFRENCKEKRPLDLAYTLVAWSTFPKEHLSMDLNIIFGNLSIIFARQSLYLPYKEEVIYDTSRFSTTSDPFAVAILWLPLREKTAASKKLEASGQSINKLKPKRKLVELLMRGLKQAILRSPQPMEVHLATYSRAMIGRYAVKNCLSLLLDACILPYFADCYCYIAKLESGDQLTLLAESGNKAAGYLPQMKAARDVPWWVTFVRERASLALAQDARNGPNHKSEYGSVVCFPLVVLDKAVGVLSIENIDKTNHCLEERHGYTDAELLRYLICIAEIAAEYLNLMESSAQKAERSKLAYTSDETVKWWLDIYRYGGSNYIRIVEEIYKWTEQTQESADGTAHLVMVDIYKEGELAARYQGFEVVIDIVRQTRKRIQSLLQDDPMVADLVADDRLKFFEEPVGEHLLLVAVGVPENYLLIVLEQIRDFWQKPGDILTWKGNSVEVALQVGVCRFAALTSYEQKIASRLMNYHLKKLAQQLYDRHDASPLDRVLVYDAVVATQRVKE